MEYVYQLPEDYELSSENKEKLDSLCRKLELTNLQAQQLVDLHVEFVDELFVNIQTALKWPFRAAIAFAYTMGLLTIILLNSIF